jgi:hypothetical protein
MTDFLRKPCPQLLQPLMSAIDITLAVEIAFDGMCDDIFANLLLTPHASLPRKDISKWVDP